MSPDEANHIATLIEGSAFMMMDVEGKKVAIGQDLKGEIADALRRAHLGATGQFPDGKISPTDEGQLRLAVGWDKDKKLVFIEFGTEVRWLSMPAAQAKEFALAILAKSAMGMVV